MSKIISCEERSVPHGIEYRTEFELSSPEGPIRIRQFTRKLDMGDTYSVLVHMAKGTSQALTILTNGHKGEVCGNYRKDQVEVIILNADGTASAPQAKEVQVSLDNPYEGLTFEETFSKLTDDPPTCRLNR